MSVKNKKNLGNKYSLTHGMRKTRFYKIWAGIKCRCNGTSSKHHLKNYHNRGITYDPHWEDFINFRDDMYEEYERLEGDKNKLQIDRIDNDGDYIKENCRWVISSVNCNNKNNSIRIGGKTLTEWFDIFSPKNITIRTVRRRYKLRGIRDLHYLYHEGKLDCIRSEGGI